MYLADPCTTFHTKEYSAIQLSDTPIELFQERLALLMNSFILASRYSSFVMGREDLSGSDVSIQAVPTRFLITPVYALDGTWIGIFFLSNLVMLGAAIVALVLKLECRGPEVHAVLFQTPTSESSWLS